MDSKFPKTFLLNGSDYFQVFLDRNHRKYGHLGNVSRLALYLDGIPNLSHIESKLNQNEFVKWMHGLSLSTSFLFQLPKWTYSPTKIIVNQHEFHQDDITCCDVVFQRDINPKKNPPVQFDLIKGENQTVFIMSWNHILMDARGAEIFLMNIELGLNVKLFATDNFPVLDWKTRLGEIKKVKDFLVPRVKDGIQLMQREKIRKRNQYRVLTFSKEETVQLDSVADGYKIGLAKSMFYLAAVQAAFRCVTDSDEKPAWVPVPQDQRRKGQIGPVMGNQVSYLFYQLPDQDQTASDTITNLKEQMMDQMRAQMPKSYHIMMDSMRRFPAWLYSRLVASPTKGALASYVFSDTGNSLQGLFNFAECKLLDAIHYPPNSTYPGLTVIFMRIFDKQQIIFGYPNLPEMESKMDKFEKILKLRLLEHE